MAKDKRSKSHGISFEFMHVGATNPAALDTDEHLVIGDLPDRELAHLDSALCGEHRRAACAGAGHRFRGRRQNSRRGCGSLEDICRVFLQDLSDDLADLFSVYFLSGCVVAIKAC